MPRVALPDSCSYARHLGVSTLHMFKIDGSILGDFWTSQFQLRLRLKTSSFDALFKILLGILGYWTSSIWDLFDRHVYKASLKSALPDPLQLC
jgi:hypothetical protein